MTVPAPIHTGKVRDTYAIEGRKDELLIVATDRISVFDVVLPQIVPGKGKVLTGMTEFWLKEFFAGVPNHLITTDVDELPPELQAIPDLRGRAMVVRKCEMLPIECIVRGYLYGSVIKEYMEEGTAAKVPLPSGLVKASRLPEPIFTPSTKATVGHDENISFEQAEAEVGKPGLMEYVKSRSISLYVQAAEYALERGIILADTKFEFGIFEGELLLADEVLTPDSSRFWDADLWVEGEEPVSFDKQYVRDYYAKNHPDWNKKAPAPDLPEEIIDKTVEKYYQARSRIVS